jgi:hypothetical protein
MDPQGQAVDETYEHTGAAGGAFGEGVQKDVMP